MRKFILFIFSLFCIIRISYSQVSILNNIGNYYLLYPGIYYDQEVPLTGHTALWDKEYAEKYTNISPIWIRGIATQNWGVVNTTDTLYFKVYDVGSNGMPGNELYSKQVKSVCMKLNGDVNYFLFDSPISVNDTFFVSMYMGDYWVQSQHDEIYVLNCGNCRSSADLNLYGRNAMRTVDGIWRDLNTARQFKTHLALFPIVSVNANDVVSYTDNSDCVWNNIAEQMEDDISVYPNPFSDYLNIKGSNQYEIKQISVVDVLGSIVTAGQYNAPEGIITISLHAISNGVYTLIVSTNNGSITKRILKQ